MEQESAIKSVIEYLGELGYINVSTEVKVMQSRIDIVAYNDSAKKIPCVIVEVKNQLQHPLGLLSPAVQQAFRYAALLDAKNASLLISDGSSHHWFQLKEEGSSLDYSEPVAAKNQVAPKTHDNFDSLDQLGGIINKAFSHLRDSGFRVDLLITRDLLKLLLAIKIDQQWGCDLMKQVELDRENSIDIINRILRRHLRAHQWNESGCEISARTAYEIIHILSSMKFNEIDPIELTRNIIEKISNCIIDLDRGVFATPLITQFFVDLVGDELYEKILDPCCKTGQLLFEYIANSILAQGATPSSINNKKSAVGVEESSTLSEVAIFIFLIAEVRNVDIRRGNGLDINLNVRGDQQYDLVMSMLPSGPLRRNDLITNEIPQAFVKSLEAFSAFIAIKSLRPGGRAVLLFPESALFSRNKKALREWILEQSEVNAIISLPPGIQFNSKSQSHTSILVLTKKSGSLAPHGHVFLADLRSSGLGSRNNPDNHKLILKTTASRFDKFKKGDVYLVNTEEQRPWYSIVKSIDVTSARMDIPGIMLESWKKTPVVSNSCYKVVSIFEVADLITGRNFSPDELAAGVNEIKYIRPSSINRFKLHDVDSFISSDQLRASGACDLLQNDILMVSMGSQIGRAVLIDQSCLPSTISGAVIAIRIKRPDLISPAYLVAFLNSQAGLDQVEQRRIKGTSLPYIRKDDVGEISIPVPPMIMQIKASNAIFNLLSRAEKMIEEANLMQKKAHELLGDFLSKGDVQ